MLKALVAAVAALLIVAAAPAPPAPAATSEPVRAAFYYPWFPETWGDGTAYHPTRGAYDSSDVSIITKHMHDMRGAGLDAGISSWWGPGSKTDERTPLLFDVADGTSFRWTLYYEREGYSDPSAAAIAADLDYIEANYAQRRSYLRVDGRPVLFIYGDPGDDCGMADRWAAANAGRFYLVEKVFPGYDGCASQPDSWHQYGPAEPVSAVGDSFAVSPGFAKPGEAPRLERDLRRFKDNVAAMVASGAQWQLITTYNEWGEGSAIEPATEWRRKYLHALERALAPATARTRAVRHPLVIIWMENKERSTIVGSSSAPYMNDLRARGRDFTHYYGVTHPSLPNYLAFAAGTPAGKTGTDSIRAGELPQTTLWAQLSAAGVGWRVYEESMPSTCYGGTSSGLYQLKHNPATPFAEVFTSTLCNRVRPYVPGVPLARVNFITPNMCNDTHDCSVATGDAWLKANVEPMLAAGATVVITYDEGSSGTNGGGNIYTVVARQGMTPSVRTGTYNHYSLLAAIEKKFGLPYLGGAAAASPLPL